MKKNANAQQEVRPIKFRISTNSINLLLTSLVILPILINPTVSASFDEIYLWPKLLWVYAVVLPAALLLLWENRYQLRLNFTIALVSTLSFWFLATGLFFSPTLLHWLGSSDRADGIIMHLVYLIIALAGLSWASSGHIQQKIEFALRLLVIGASALALTNILQQLSVMGIPGEGAFMGISATLFGGTLGNRGYLGGALALLLPLALSLLVRQPHVIWHWGAVVIISWALAGSYARGAWLAGAAGLVWLLICQPQVRRLRFWWPVVLGVALVYPAQTLSMREGRSFQSDGNTSQLVEALTSHSGRSVLWQSALYGIFTKPVTGWGASALWKAMNSRPDEELLAEYGVKNIQSFRRLNTTATVTEPPSFLVIHTDGTPERVTMNINKVHNEYLDYALTYGIPAALIFIALLALAIWSGKTLAPSISAGLLAYAIYLFTWPEIIRFAPTAWFMVGICLALGQKTSIFMALETKD